MASVNRYEWVQVRDDADQGEGRPSLQSQLDGINGMFAEGYEPVSMAPLRPGVVLVLIRRPVTEAEPEDATITPGTLHDFGRRWGT